MYRKFFYVSSLAFLSCLVSMSYAVPVGTPIEWPISSGGNGHFYKLMYVEGGISWTDAKTLAEEQLDLGVASYLATITSELENKFIVDNLLNNSPSIYYWLGGFQPDSHIGDGWPEPDKNWKWITTDEDWNYTNWSPAEPTNSFASPLGHEDALVIWKLDDPIYYGKWNDYPHAASDIQGLIVEYVPEPAAILLLGLGGLASLRKRKA
jgi:hypothetical protein